MRIRNRLALGASCGVLAGGLVVSACGGDDSSVPPAPTEDAGVDATSADTGTAADGGGDTGTTKDGGTSDTGPGTTGDGGADSGTDGAADGSSDAGLTNVLYTMSNDPTSGKNAIYAYRRGGDGSLTPIAGSPFATGGTGIGNPGQALGPEDSDYQIIASPDHQRLFAVNGGSDTISVFDIHADGTLAAVAGSPFSSNGLSPVSLAFAHGYLLATNQDRDLGRPTQTGSAANYATLVVSDAGALSAAPGVTPQPAGITANQLLPTADGTLVFGDEFTFSAATATPGLRSFTLGTNGALTKAPGDVYAIPADDGGPDGSAQADQLVLGIALNPLNPVLYVNYVIRGEVSAWTYGTDGTLTSHGSAKVSGGAPCWIRVSKDGKFLYVTDTALDQVSVLSASSDGLTLQEIQVITLAGAGPTLDAGPNMGHTASESYDEQLSPDGKFLYVVSERLTSDSTYTEGNMIHVLAVDATTGKLTETAATTPLDPDAGVPITARAEGLVVF